MKSLTICEPYATAIIGTASIPGPKRCENRSQIYSYRGPLLIHAGKSTAWLDSFECVSRAMLGLLRSDLTFGAIIGRVDLVDCLDLDAYLRRYPQDAPWANGPWCLRVENPVRFPRPIPYRGQLGLFDVSDSALVCL
jgi:hypothetical protein